MKSGIVFDIATIINASMKTLQLLLPCLLLAYYGCNLSDNPENDFNETHISQKTAHLIDAENKFGFALFHPIYSSETEYENILVSPLSVSLALAMTYNGAREETKTSMEKTLGVYGLTPDDINASYLFLVESLKSLDEKVLLEIANAIFYRTGFTVENEFISINKKYYDASVSALDFENQQQALNTINGWVKEKTHDKIESILDRITPGNVMFLLNAIYFKGIWQKQFNEKNTVKRPFTTGKGAVIETETMQRSDTLPYFSNDMFSAIELAYGKGKYNMYVFLPQNGRNLKELIDMMNQRNWNAWMKSFKQTENVDIRFPRFKYEYEILLNDVLTDMGMGIAFTEAANFTGINRQDNLFIDYVKHKAFVEVNEEGTEAAAVTVVAIGRTSVEDSQRIQFIVDRPFFYAITEKTTGAIVFMGTVKDPSLN